MSFRFIVRGVASSLRSRELHATLRLVPLCLGVILLCLAAGCQKQEEPELEEPSSIELRGTVAPRSVATVAAPVDGRLTQLLVREGQAVQKSTLLASISNPSIARELAIATAQRELAELRIRDGGRPRAVLSPAVSSDDPTAAILANKRKKLETYRRLFDSRDISRAELEQAENEHAAALRDYQNERRVPGQVPQTVSARVLELELQKARADEEFARARNDQLQIVAPIAGVVTAVHKSAGETIFPQQPIVEIADTTMLLARATIAPELLRFARPGTSAEVKVLTVPPRTFIEKIDHVIPFRPGGGAEGAAIAVLIPNPNREIQPNTPVKVTVRWK